MTIRIFAEARHVSRKTERLREYLRNPFSQTFMRRVKDKLRENIRSSDGRPLPYHTYPSDHQGNLEASVYVERSGPTQLVFGSDAEYAHVLEFGRPAKSRKKPYCFRGYYPNPRAIAKILKDAWKVGNSKWLTQSIGRHPSREISSLVDSVTQFRGKSRPYKGSLKDEAMKKQNIRTIRKLFEADISEMKHRTTKEGERPHITGKGSGANRTILSTMKRNVRDLGIPSEAVKLSGVGWGGKPKKGKKLGEGAALKYGIYTVFTRHTKAIAPYRVFSKTAVWAKNEFINEVKKGVRKK